MIRDCGVRDLHPVQNSDTRYQRDRDRPSRDTREGACGDCPAERFGLCARLSPTCRQHLRARVQRDSHDQGAVIGAEGAPGQSIIVVTEGIVALTKQSAEGRTIIVGFRYPGEIVMPYRHAFTWPVTVRALVPCRTCRVPFAALPHQSPSLVEIEEALLDLGVEQIEDGFRHMLVLGHRDVDRKVAAFVLDFAARSHGGQVPKDAMDIPVTREQIASYLGLRTETVSRAFQRLKERKLFALPKPRQIAVLDEQALAALAADS